MGRMIVTLAMLFAVLAFGPAFAKDGGNSGPGGGDGDNGGHDGGDDGNQVVTTAPTTGGGGTETVNNPEPGTLLLLSTGIAGVGAVTWRRLRRK